MEHLPNTPKTLGLVSKETHILCLSVSLSPPYTNTSNHKVFLVLIVKPSCGIALGRVSCLAYQADGQGIEFTNPCGGYLEGGRYLEKTDVHGPWHHIHFYRYDQPEELLPFLSLLDNMISETDEKCPRL